MVRSNVIDMVLATELGKHFEHVNKFISSTRVSDEPSDGSGRSPRVSTISLNNQQSENDDAELRTLVKRVLIKVAGMFLNVSISKNISNFISRCFQPRPAT